MKTPKINSEPLPACDGSVYPTQDSESLGEHYIRHICAMTSESLHAKSDIARQLAARDKMLSVLWAEYEDRKAQWGSDYLWTKHEDADAIAEVKAFIAQTQNASTVPTAGGMARELAAQDSDNSNDINVIWNHLHDDGEWEVREVWLNAEITNVLREFLSLPNDKDQAQSGGEKTKPKESNL